MTEKQLQEILIQNLNQLLSNENNHTPSMKYLSQCIGANDSYIQKIMTGLASPSLDKLNAIANHFDMEPWMLLIKSDNRNHELLSLLQLIKSCPSDLFPVIHAFITYLVTHQSTQP